MKSIIPLLFCVLVNMTTVNISAAAPVKVTPPEVTANGELFYINGSMGKLAARMSLPELSPGEKCPMVIFSHGFGGNMNFHLFEPLIQRLNQAGIGVVRFDFNGCGKSDGKFQDMTVPNEIDDLLCVIGYVRQLSVTKNISLLGHSQGGVVTSMVAGECGYPQIECEVLLSAASVLRDDALRGITHGGHFDPWHLDQTTYEVGGAEPIGRGYIQTAMNLPIYETSAKYNGPALIVNGMADVVVPYTYAKRYHTVLKDSEIIIIPGEDHSYNYSPEYVVDLVANWLISQLIK